MSIPRGVRVTLISFVVLVALIALALVFAPPLIVRYAVLHYLDSHGVNAQIGNVDANIFTGHLAIDNARGQRRGGKKDNASDGFQIRHLAVDINYPPLFNNRLSIARLALAGARVDITRTPDNGLRIGGVPISGGSSGGSSKWGFGLHQLKLGALRVHYRQPGKGQQPAIDQVVTLNDSNASDVITWQPGQKVPLDANIAVAGGSLKISGHINPFGDHLAAHLNVVIDALPASLFAPLAQLAGMKKLTGTLSANQTVDISYRAKQALSIDTDGKLHWSALKVARPSGLVVKAQGFGWQGKSQATLLRPAGKPGEIKGNGTFTINGLNGTQPGSFTLRQKHTQWQGKLAVTLAKTTRISTHGKFQSSGTDLSAGQRLKLTSDSEMLNGDIETTITGKQTTIASNGQFAAAHMSFAVPGSLDVDAGKLNWDGTTQTTLGQTATRIDSNGQMDADSFSFTVPDSSDFNASHVSWKGTTHIDSEKLFARAASGRLIANDAKLTLPGTPIALSADRLVYDGRYAEQPDAAGDTLKLSMDGEADAHELAVTNTSIGAPWYSAIQSYATGIAIDGLSSIRIDTLKSKGVRIMGDTNTSSSVVQAVSLDMSNFALMDLAHYSIEDLSIDSAIVHTRRDAAGYGVISEFFDTRGSQAKSKSKSSAGAAASSGSSSTYAIKHFAISGPSMAFVDTTTTPDVKIAGSDLNFVLEDLDTGHQNQSATYRLSMDLGAYGHLDSKGDIAPFAEGGINMDMKAWLRSLAMGPLSGYLNAAMGRRIAQGAVDGTLDLKADKGQLKGTLDATLSNFRMVEDGKTTDIALGISMETALALVRGQDDEIHFKTKVLGDATNPYFSVDNLVREAVLAGVRTALLSDYSPIGLLNKVRNAFLNLFRSVQDRPAKFAVGKHYVQPDDRHYLGLIAQAMVDHPKWSLTIQGHAVPADAKAMSVFQGGRIDSSNRLKLSQLAAQRAEAIHDYLAARRVDPTRIHEREPVVSDDASGTPQVTFTLDKG